MIFWVDIVVAAPAHSTIAGPLTYHSEHLLELGQLVRVPLGKREVLGVVWALRTDSGQLDPQQSKQVAGTLDGVPPLSATWRQLIAFTASYYQRALGEVALAALPPQLRELDTTQLARRLKRGKTASESADSAPLPATLPELSPEQAQALKGWAGDHRPALLFGVTGSGKTEIYLRAAAQALEADSLAQVLVMVPEINLTPQLQSRFESRFSHLGAGQVVALHSGLTPAQRLKSWLLAHTGQARLVLGTRMAVLASLPALRLIVVDEEHDPSYKQQEGARYSARDLAVYRARLEGQTLAQEGACRVLLGSATPSLESWQAALSGRYMRLDMASRIGAAAHDSGPEVRVIDMGHQPRHAVLAPPLLQAIAERVARGEQSMIFLNRRGYAPVLACHACGWKSQCAHCSAYRVFHKLDRTLRCHHCGFTERVPRGCPDCGNVDIAPLGKGTEKLEEHLAELLVDVKRPDGSPVRVARIDADSTRLKGTLQTQLAQVHAGEVDVLVGTQMVTKGHDFRHITLVAAVNPDSSLFSSDFRAPERLFSLLMQAAGRAGRDAAHSARSQMWVQTAHPGHPLFAALKRYDYPGFAEQELSERLAAGLPPFGYAALLRAEARTQELAQAFLEAVAEAGRQAGLPGADRVTIYPAVPMALQRVANVERAQMLLECDSRPALQQFLTAWQAVLAEVRRSAAFKPLIRWAIDVDPLAI